MRSSIRDGQGFRWIVLAFTLASLVATTDNVVTADDDKEQVAAPETGEATEPASPSPSQRSPDEGSRSPLIDLPPTLPGGRPIYPIGLYQSQLVELIPKSYRPVAVSELREAIDRLAELSTDDQTSRLRGAEYWVKWDDGVLVSDRSLIDIESDREAIVRRSLGPVNLAIRPSGIRASTASSGTLPRLESDIKGDLIAVFQGGRERRTQIEFQWQLNGRSFGSGQEFNLRLPRTPQTRIVLALPPQVEIETLDGVLRSRPGPPSDAGERLADRESRWYEIDAGGLAAVRIRTKQVSDKTAAEAVVLRRSTMQYEVDPSGLNWTQRMVVQLPVNRSFPLLEVIGATVTGVKVNASEASFTRKQVDRRSARGSNPNSDPLLQEIQIELPPGVVNSQSTSVTLTITGQSTWQDRCPLPMAHFVGERVVYASATDEAQLGISGALDVVSWDLPGGWTQSAPRWIDGVRLYTASGPPIEPPTTNATPDAQPSAPESSSSPESSSAPESSYAQATPGGLATWSSVRIQETAMLRSADTLVALEVGKGEIKAKAQITIRVDPKRLEPILLEVQSGWTLDAVSFASTGRVIETPTIDPSGPRLSLWPEPEDVVRDPDGQAILVLEASGMRTLASNGPLVVVPPSWFIVTNHVRGKFVTAVVPPDDLNWSGETALQRDRVRSTELAPRWRDFFQNLNSKALYFVPATGRTPELRLEKPGIAFDVSTQLDIQRDGDEIVERLVIDVQSAGQNLKELVVQTGGERSNQEPDSDSAIDAGPQVSGDKFPGPQIPGPQVPGPQVPGAEYFWAIGPGAGSPSNSLPFSDVISGSGDAFGTYRIDVSELDLRGRPLIARRRYPVGDSFRLPLPSVPGAASQRSEVTLGAGLLIQEKSPSVQLVPATDPEPLAAGVGERDPRVSDSRVSDSQDSDSGTSTGLGGDAESGDPAAPAVGPRREGQRLRYDAVEQPSIVIATTNATGNVTIVWQEQIRVVASSRGADQIEAAYRVSPTAPLVIKTEPDMQLISITRDGQPVDLETVSMRPIRLEPRRETETIRLVWNRTQSGSAWTRSCRIPKIEVAAVVLKSSCQLVSASDTFAPAALFRFDPASGGGAAVEVDPSDTIVLVRRNVTLSIGWFIALMVFVIGWVLGARRPLTVASIVVVMSAVLFLWWDWKLAVIGWMIVPLITGAMLATSRAWTIHGSELTDAPEPSDRDGSSRLADDSADLSWASFVRTLTTWLGPIVLAMAAGYLCASAQEIDGRDASQGQTPVARPVQVLVPVDASGLFTGDIVYIPRSVHARLFQTDLAQVIQEPRFESARYRVKIGPPSTTGAQDSSADPAPMPAVSVEAEYVIHLVDGNRGSNQVRFPIQNTTVRRVELIDDIEGTVRFAADAEGQMVATLPRGETFRLQVTLLPMASKREPWTKLFVSIPPIGSSRLTVEADQNIEALRVGGPSGRLIDESDLRRWVTELGPVDSLEIDFRAAPLASSIAAKPLGRRYWINAGQRRVAIECEVDPPTTAAAGETFQFVIRDSEMPVVTSGNWRLEGSEMYSSARRLVTMTSLRDTPGPIRLLWSRVREESLGGDADSERIEIPEVIAAALGENGSAWIAHHCDPALRFAPAPRDAAEPLSVDQYMAAWTGYRGRIDRAFVALDAIAPMQLLRKESAPTTASFRHHLHVMPDRLELQFGAMIKPGDGAAVQRRLSIPRDLELIELSVDAAAIESPPVRMGDTTEYLLGDISGSTPVTIKAIAVERIRSDRRFSPPLMSIVPAMPSSGLYSMSRDASTSLRTIKDVSIKPLGPEPQATAESLAQGWIPISTWLMSTSEEVAESTTGADRGAVVDSSRDLDDLTGLIIPNLSFPPLGVSQWAGVARARLDRQANAQAPGSLQGQQTLDGTFEVRPRKTRFGCRQMIELVRDDGRWKMQTEIKFDGNRAPDFVDVEIPTRWCEMLEVAPRTSWSRQPGTDSAGQVIRIRCDADELEKQTLTITGYLQSADAGRVGVPNIRVLGLGGRRVHISVPDRLTNEPIQWRTSAVEAVELPRIWQRPDRQADEPIGQRSVYVAANASWSIDLAPLPTLSSDALALTQDNQVFTQSDRVLAISHWDLFPGGLEAVEIRLPEGARCMGAWSAGQAAIIDQSNRTRSRPDELKLSGPVVRVPLALSRLTQPLEILVEIPSDSAKRGDYVPRLVDIPVTQNWLSVYEQSDRPAAPASPRDTEDQNRAISLARSVVESVEQAVDIIAERPTGEVASWLYPWLARYEQLAKADGHRPDFDIAVAPRDALRIDADGTPVAVAGSAVAGSKEPAWVQRRSQWALFDNRMAVYVNRYLTERKGGIAPMFAVADFDGFQAKHVAQLSTIKQTPLIQPESTSDRGLRKLIASVITLGIVAGLLVCMRPLRRFVFPMVVHPAFWLAWVGIFGFAVAPVPVAAAIVLVAISMAVLPNSSSRRTGFSASR